MAKPDGATSVPPEAVLAETLRHKLIHWRTELAAGRPVELADPSDPNPLAGEWERYRKAEADFWTYHANKLPSASWDTVQTAVDLYWWLLGRVRCLKLLHPELADPPRLGPEYPVPPHWINEACDLAVRYGIPRDFVKPASDVTPQRALSIFDSLLMATDREIQRRNGGLPWRGPLAIDATAQQFDRMGKSFEDRSQRAAKAAHLEADVNELAIQAGRLLYRAIDSGAWEGQWPWGWARKPGRDLFLFKDDFAQLPSDQADDVDQNPERFREGGRLRLPRPEVIPDDYIKPDRIAWAFWIAALNVAGQYPNAFRINPMRLDLKDADGDEGDRLAFWRRRADVFADACRFISTLLRQQQSASAEGAGVQHQVLPPVHEASARRRFRIPICRQDRSALHPDVAAAFDAAYAALGAAASLCEHSGDRGLLERSTARTWWGNDLEHVFKSIEEFSGLVTTARLKLKPVHAKLTFAHHTLKHDGFPKFGGITGDCGHDVAVKLVGDIASICVAQPGFLAMELSPKPADAEEPKELKSMRMRDAKWRMIYPHLQQYWAVDGDALVALMWTEAVIASEGRPKTPPVSAAPKQPIELHRDDLKILRVLAKARSTLFQCDLEAALKGMLSRKTISKRLTTLREQGLTHRPKRDRGGEAITDAGRAALTGDSSGFDR